MKQPPTQEFRSYKNAPHRAELHRIIGNARTDKEGPAVPVISGFIYISFFIKQPSKVNDDCRGHTTKSNISTPPHQHVCLFARILSADPIFRRFELLGKFPKTISPNGGCPKRQQSPAERAGELTMDLTCSWFMHSK